MVSCSFFNILLIPIKRIRIDLYLWWREWKRLHWKHKGPYSLEDLEKIRHFNKMLSFTYLFHVIVLLGMVVEMYLKEQGDIVVNTVLICVMIALFDTRMEIAHINQLIYFKRRYEYENY